MTTALTIAVSVDLKCSWLVAYLIAINTATFLTYAYDKHAARRGKPRVRERTLHLLALLGGSPAALAAQQLFRHKTAKRSFLLMFWAIVALQLSAIVYLLANYIS